MTAEPAQRIRYGELVTPEITTSPEGVQREIRGYRLADKLYFKDDAGQEHELFIDVGQHEEMGKLVVEKNWEEVKRRYPKFTGQTHDYEAYNKRLDDEQDAAQAAGTAKAAGAANAVDDTMAEAMNEEK